MSDGIDVYFDSRCGRLTLACEPDAFALHRELAGRQISDFPEIPMVSILEIVVVDSQASAAQSNRNGSVRNLLLWIAGAATVALAIVGAVSLIERFAA